MQIESREQFGAVLTRLRREAGLSIRKVADRAGVPVPTLGGWYAGNAVPAIDAAAYLESVLKVCGATDRFEELWEAANRIRGTARPARPANSPYRSLEPYRAQDACLFFGREDLIEELSTRVGRGLRGEGTRLIGVLGCSGSGKTSLLQAGLLPKLDVPNRYFEPGADPGDRLDMAMASDGTEGPAVLVIDQAEELWTYEDTSGSSEARMVVAGEFVDRLVGLTETGKVVVFAMRADYFARALELPVLRAALTTDAVAVGPMTRQQLEQAIVMPAKGAGVHVEPALLALLLQELAVAGGGAHDPGALPLLSHALHATWIGRTTASERLTVEHYRSAGGIRAAIELTAEKVWSELDSKEAQTACERLFVRAVHRGDTALARITVDPAELDWPDIDRRNTAAVIDRFVAARLLTMTSSGVQITHEALLHTWQRLRSWLAEDAAGHAMHTQLTAHVRNWDRHDPSTLLSAARTEEYQLWAGKPSRGRSLTVLESEYVAASASHHAAVARAELWQLRRLYALSAALFLVAVISIAATVFAVRYSRSEAAQYRISHAHEQASASYVVRSGAPDVGGLLAVQAFRAQPDVQTRSALLETQADRFLGRISVGDFPLYGVASSPDGKLIAASGFDGKVRLWDARTRRELTDWVAAPEGGSAVVFSPDSTKLAHAQGGTLRVWSPVDYSLRGERQGIEGGMSNLAFSPDGRVLAGFAKNAYGTTVLQFLDPATLSPLPTPPGSISGAGSLAFSASTGIFAAAGTGPVQVWPSLDTAPITLSRSWAERGVAALALSRDGRVVAASDNDGWVTLWNLADGGREIATKKFDSAAYGLDFTPDGSVLAIGLDNRSVQLLDTASGQAPFATLIGHSNSIHRIAFTEVGDTLLTASSDGSIGIWDTSDLTLRSVQPISPVSALARGRDSAALTAATRDGSVHQWNPAGGYRRQFDPRWREPAAAAFVRNDRSLVIGGQHGLSVLDTTSSAVTLLSAAAVVGVAVSADTFTLAVAFDDDSIQRWDTRSWNQLAPVPVPEGQVLTGLTFGGNTMLAATAYTDNLLVWDLSATEPQLSMLRTHVTAAAFSPNARFLAYANMTGQIKVYDIQANDRLDRVADYDLTVLHPAAPDRSAVGRRHTTNSLTFSPDGQLLAAASNDGLTRIWAANQRAGFTPHAILQGHNGATSAATFESTSTHLVTAGEDGVLRRWNLDTDMASTQACSAAATSDQSRWLERDTALLDADSC
ncbi:hypothetical protein GCM10027088_50980 [Nocardia goodfellowii]